MSIQLQFSTQGDLGSSIIKLWQHGFWATHVDVVQPDGQLLGARWAGGVAVRPHDYQAFPRVLVATIQANVEQGDLFSSFLQDQVGKPYDGTAIEGMVLGRSWRSQDKWFCSELVAAAMEASGILRWPLASSIERITPADLVLVCSVLSNLGGTP